MGQSMTMVGMAVATWRAILRHWVAFGLLSLLVITCQVVADATLASTQSHSDGDVLLVILMEVITGFLVVLLLYQFARDSGSRTLFPKKLFGKTLRTLIWLLLFSLLLVIARYMMEVGWLAGIVTALVWPILQIPVGIVGAVLAGSLPLWFLFYKSLVLPGIAASDDAPFSNAHILLIGRFKKFVGSLVLVMLSALVLSGVLWGGAVLMYSTSVYESSFVSKIVFDAGVKTVLVMPFYLMAFAWLGVWYKRLRLCQQAMQELLMVFTSPKTLLKSRPLSLPK